MTIPRSAAEVLNRHVVFEVESIDRLYLNLYVPILQSENGIAHFWRAHRGYDFASSALMAPMTRSFVSSIESFAEHEGIDLIQFTKGQRKEDVAQEYYRRSNMREGVLFIGKAQEKSKVTRTEKRRNPSTGSTYAWLKNSTAMVNHYYFYCVDCDFGLFFLKFSSYFPYNAKVCLNGHEYAKRQLDKHSICYKAWDNSILSCADPQRLCDICNGLSAERIDALIRKWFRRLPYPYPAKDRKAGYLYSISILQAEFALTQVFDRPLASRVFMEQIIRENLDMGRPDHVQLIFDRRIIRRTPGRFRTRVITDDVVPSFHIDYKNSKIKQYCKGPRREGLRTECLINNTRDFAIGRKLHNLSELREVGFAANRRLLAVQRISFDCSLGEMHFEKIVRPVKAGNQRAAALRLGDLRVFALLSALLVFRLSVRGFTNSDLRFHVAPLLGILPEQMTPGMMTYDLRRLRLHGLIERVGGYRYQVTEFGVHAALFITRAYTRLLLPGCAAFGAPAEATSKQLSRALQDFDEAINRLWKAEVLVA